MSSLSRSRSSVAKKGGKKQSDVHNMLATSERKNKTSRSVKVRVKNAIVNLRPIEKGYYRSDQPMSTGGQQRYRVLVDTELQRMISSLNNTPAEARPLIRQLMPELKKKAKAIVFQEAFVHSRAPFGRQKGVTYTWNQDTGVVEYAGAVYICQEPEDYIRPADLQAQAQSRFNSGGRRLSFTPKTAPQTVDDLQRMIERQHFVQGVSGDSEMAAIYKRKKRARAKAKRFRQQGLR